MLHFIEIPIVGNGALTDEHPGGYGQKLFVRNDGIVYGPNDVVGKFGVTAKDMAKASSQFTGSALKCWNEDIIDAIKNW